VADLATRQARLLREVAIDHVMVGALAIGMTALAAAGALAESAFTVAGIGWAPLLILAAYLLGTRLLYKNRAAVVPSKESPDDGGLKRPVIGFAISAAAILAAAPYLARSGATLAEQWGISSGFFGVVFLAAATSLPEVSVVVAALRRQAYDLAVGNLLGSNCFNMAILLILDLADGSEALLEGMEPGVVVGALFAILLMTQVLLDIQNRPERRVWYLEPGPALVVVTYAVGLFLTYRATH
jgi:cation:H+ antiporter